MKVIFLKKLSLMLLVPLVFTGCSFQASNYVDYDKSVNMVPRQISVTQNQEITDVIEEVRSAVVGISATSPQGYSVGSGVAVADGGYILTNNHVVANASSLVVYFANKTQSKAETLWTDAALDLAVIKSEINLPYLEYGNMDDIKVGDDILAIGTPLTLQFKHTVTKGIVSALNRTLEVEGTNGTAYLQNLIQHDASINPGNSGGPLINNLGQVIGINTVKATEAEGIGFAIPINVGKSIVNKISQNNGYKPPYLGIFGLDADIAEYYNQSLAGKGVYVVSIDTAGSAAKAGLKKGDVITKLGDKSINTMLDLRTCLFEYDKGDNMSLEIYRDGNVEIISFVGD